ncbi:MAG TPA: type I methionyl aminopeptidase [Pseudolysinimonas sp.]|nr:type I methionyl aminopeptidase [Pseudolysinimonas sp.]
MPRNASGHLTAGRLSPERAVPREIPRPEYVGRREPRTLAHGDVYTADEVAHIRESGRIAAGAVQAVGAAIRPGITTDELDGIAHRYLIERGAYPSTLHYRGYPKSSCISLNEVICHGIPDDTGLLEGDIVNVDVTAYKDGMHGDLNATFPVGVVSQQAADLVERTREALNRGIKAVAPGRPVNVIGRAIESYARRFGYGVVRDYTGHGVGAMFHSGLVIPHYDAAPAHAELLEPGMVFTIEPMLTLGTTDWDLWDDDWTVVTRDRGLSAQFEHTLVVTDRGCEVLTLP